jgi:ubiquinone/menaquinone biosynthesis C-methylase UbiE
VLDAITGAFGLGPGDIVVDLGCSTGQLAVPMASRVRAVLGVDPEPDMLARARPMPGAGGLAD